MIPDTPIFAPEILAQVVKLLKHEQTEKLLQILRTRIVEISEMDDVAIAGPDGMAHMHRLTSEAGMLGFRRLSTVCAILDDGPTHRSPEHMAWAWSELRPTLERSHLTIFHQLNGALGRNDDGLKN